MTLGLFVTGGLLLSFIAWRGSSVYSDYWDYGAAERELPQAIADYRAAGMPWTAAELQGPPIPPAENAAPFLWAAIEEIRNGSWEDESAALTNAANAGDWATVAARLSTRQVGLALLESAADRPRSDFGGDPDLSWNAITPGGPELSAGVEALTLRARLSALCGRGDQAIRDIARVRALARLVGMAGGETGYMRQVRFERIALRAAWRVAAIPPASRAACSRRSTVTDRYLTSSGGQDRRRTTLSPRSATVAQSSLSSSSVEARMRSGTPPHR